MNKGIDEKPHHIDHRFTPIEEIINSATHGLGAVLGLIGFVFLLNRALTIGREGSVIAVIVYGAALVLLYSFSALHHGIPSGIMKKIFLSLDHAGIFLLIAGTYTPFCLLMPPGHGWTLFSVIWGLAIGGVVFQTLMFLGGRDKQYERMGFLLHLALGWFPILFAGSIIFGSLPWGGLGLLIAGGLAYSIGVIFYLWRSLPYNHAYWHSFVIGGSTFHFFTIFYFVVPATVA